jgi:hypothetical protein
VQGVWRGRIGLTLAGLVGEARIGYFVAYYFDDDALDYKVHLPSKDGTVTSIHVLFDENIPSREEEYFSRDRCVRVKVAGDRPRTSSICSVPTISMTRAVESMSSTGSWYGRS